MAESESTAPTYLVALTGVTSGIGQALAKELYKQGHTVCGCGRRAAELENLEAELTKGESDARKVHLTAVDVGVDSAVQDWCQSVLKDVGVPNLVLHCAAVQSKMTAIDELDTDAALTAYNINTLGYVRLAKGFLPAMKAAASDESTGYKGGVIAAMNSFHGKIGGPFLADYCATKWALEGMVRSLAGELKDDCSSIGAVCVSPGFVKTAMTAESYELKLLDFIPDADEWAVKCAPWLTGYLIPHAKEASGLSLAPPLEREVMTKYCESLAMMTATEMDIKDYGHESYHEGYTLPSDVEKVD